MRDRYPNQQLCMLFNDEERRRKKKSKHTHTHTVDWFSLDERKEEEEKEKDCPREICKETWAHPWTPFFFLLLFFSSSIPPLLSFRGQQSVQLQYRAIRFRFQSWLRLRSRLLDTFRLLLSRRKKDCTARVRQCVFLTPLPPCVCCVLCVLTVFPRNRPTRVSTLIPSFSCFVGFKRDHLSR